MNAEGFGETDDIFEGNVSFTAFHATHVRAVYSSFGGESFLAQSCFFSQGVYAITESFQLGVFHRSAV